MYKYIWQYYVKYDFIDEFEKIYGTDGAWVQLFKRGDGYHSTELLHDFTNERRYVTIDSWISRSACETFRKQFAAEFDELDNLCESLTEEEIFLGSFNLSGESLNCNGIRGSKTLSPGFGDKPSRAS